jgi:hypothetical protein
MALFALLAEIHNLNLGSSSPDLGDRQSRDGHGARRAKAMTQLPSIQNDSGLPQGPMVASSASWACCKLAERVPGRNHARYKTTRLHHAARRRGGGMAACCARAAADDAGSRIPQHQGARGGPTSLGRVPSGFERDGYVEGQNVTIEYRWAYNQYEIATHQLGRFWSEADIDRAALTESGFMSTRPNLVCVLIHAGIGRMSALGANRRRRDGGDDVNDPTRTLSGRFLL